MQSLKRKMENLQEEEHKIQTQSRKRIQHLENLHSIPSLADVKYDQWARTRLDRLLVDHMLRCGYSESARQLAQEKDVEGLVDLGVFMQCEHIAASLRRGETREALQWCGENKAALKKSQVCIHHMYMYFDLLANVIEVQSGIRTTTSTIHRDDQREKVDRGHDARAEISHTLRRSAIDRDTPCCRIACLSSRYQS